MPSASVTGLKANNSRYTAKTISDDTQAIVWNLHTIQSQVHWLTNMTCKEVLLQYLKDNPKQWHKKVNLYVIAEDWSPETVGRDLREMEQEKIINVDYYDGKHAKGLAMYSYEHVPKLKTRVQVVDGIARLTEYYE